MDTKALTTPQAVFDAFDTPNEEGNWTYLTMMDGMGKIKNLAVEDKDEAVRLAQLFVQGYAGDIVAKRSTDEEHGSVTPEEAMQIAKGNIGYCTGYFGPDMGKFWFPAIKCAHPVFGTSYPSSEEALAVGKKMAEEAKG
jgi:hypothetical protein